MIAALFGVGVLTGGEDEKKTEERAAPDVDGVAHRIERIRGLEFRRLPRVRAISAEQAREEGLAALDKDYPPKRRAADETVLTLLGLLPQGSDLRELEGKVFGEEVAGFYDDRKKTMTLVEGGGAGTEGEITLAHELTHALEDQHFGIRGEGGLDDERTAYGALVEGSATVAMVDYMARHLTRGAGREEILGQLSIADLFESSSGLPPYLQRSLLFPYSQGARFVAAIGTWGPVNRALAGRGPVSTEQVLHPSKFRSGEGPLHVAAGRSPGRGWKRASHGTVGEFDTAEIVRTSDSPVRAARAAEGWGGGRYALWRRGDDSALALSWRWDSPRDAAEFAAELPRYVEQTLGGRPAGAGVWRAPKRGYVAVGLGDVVRLSVAPSRQLAERLAR